LTRGRLEISFATVEQLAEAMFALAKVLDTDVDAFAQAYEPEKPLEVSEYAAEVEALLAEIEEMKKEHAARTVFRDESSQEADEVQP